MSAFLMTLIAFFFRKRKRKNVTHRKRPVSALGLRYPANNIAICFTYRTASVLRLANTPTGRAFMAFEVKSLLKLATHCLNFSQLKTF